MTVGEQSISPEGATSKTTPQAPPGRFACRTFGAQKYYGEGETQVRALDNIDVGFKAEQLTSIMGPSGSGKSTLMHCLAGLDQLTGGEAWVGETNISTLDEGELTTLRRDRIGFVFQAFNLVPTLSAAENITLPVDLAGASVDTHWLAQVVDAVGLANRMDHKPNELSGGQQQRVAVARALASKPDIIFADEPTGNLDSKSGATILAFLQAAVRDLGQTIVMVTHDPVAAGYADRVVFLKDGHIVGELEESTAERVLTQMNQLGEETAS